MICKVKWISYANRSTCAEERKWLTYSIAHWIFGEAGEKILYVRENYVKWNKKRHQVKTLHNDQKTMEKIVKKTSQNKGINAQNLFENIYGNWKTNR